jgi:hypothetical protein
MPPAKTIDRSRSVASGLRRGPSAGFTFTIDQFVLSGRLLPDNKTLLLSATDPMVSTLSFNGLMVPGICNFSGTAVKVRPEGQ